MSECDVEKMGEMMSREMTEDDYLNLLGEKLEREINKTPTGDLRNLLTELNIVLQTKPGPDTSGQDLLEKITYDYFLGRWIDENDVDLHTLRITLHYMRKLAREHFNLDK